MAYQYNKTGGAPAQKQGYAARTGAAAPATTQKGEGKVFEPDFLLFYEKTGKSGVPYFSKKLNAKDIESLRTAKDGDFLTLFINKDKKSEKAPDIVIKKSTPASK